MRLVQVEDGDAWALIDEGAAMLRMVSGGVTAWGARIAGGEGVWALPINGRLATGMRDAIEPERFRRVLGVERLSGGAVLAGVLGAPIEGRRSPVHSLCGYILVEADLRLGPVLVTRGEFPDTPATLHDGVLISTPDLLRQLDAREGLRAGDVVILGEPLLTAHQRARLSAPLTSVTVEAA